jgi:hypothetical protein
MSFLVMGGVSSDRWEFAGVNRSSISAPGLVNLFLFLPKDEGSPSKGFGVMVRDAGPVTVSTGGVENIEGSSPIVSF